MNTGEGERIVALERLAESSEGFDGGKPTGLPAAARRGARGRLDRAPPTYPSDELN